MTAVELTSFRAMKVWWSFLWRTWVFMIPVSLLLVIIMAIGFFAFGGSAILHGAPPNPSAISPAFAVIIGLMYLVFIPATLAIQIIALKLALRVRWADFYFVAVSSEPPLSQ